jgi:hypothetical protein
LEISGGPGDELKGIDIPAEVALTPQNGATAQRNQSAINEQG